MRDSKGNCISVCNMENFDPVGVHTGDSIVVAPSQTLTDQEFHMLRTAALDIVDALEVIGGCNIQFALDPYSSQYYVIEVNPRVSRSSALASKATGYPIAKIAVKLAVGYTLNEIINPLTRTTFASFEPALDYVVVKFPRWPFDKFPEANRVLGTKMKATGEVMAIERSMEAAFHKAVQSLDISSQGLEFKGEVTDGELLQRIGVATDLRFFELLELMRRGYSVSELHEKTEIDSLFLGVLQHLVETESSLKNGNLDEHLYKQAKEQRFEDDKILALSGKSPESVASWKEDLKPVFKMVDTCAGEFEAVTNYVYSTYYGENEIEPLEGEKKVLIIGAGPIRIGQGVEFDYSAVKAIQRLKEHGYTTITVNNNPETVSTDYETADRLYFEPITKESILAIIAHESIDAVIVQFGGQTALNLARDLEEHGVELLGTSFDTIDHLEDRERFYDLLDQLDIPHVKGDICHSRSEAIQVAKTLTYPLLCRPSYVIGGKGMVKVETAGELKELLEEAEASYFPILIDEFKAGGEVEVDLVADGKKAYIPGVMEHIERAGVHSGDSMSIFPSESVPEHIVARIGEYADSLISALGYKGLMNIQFLLKDDELLMLEVNPRASRTIPIVSKIIGYPLVDMAIDLLADPSAELEAFDVPTVQDVNVKGVKYPVFSSHALPELDQTLGANMKSTGEGLCIGRTVEEALHKVFVTLHDEMEAGGTIFVDAKDSDLVKHGTSGTTGFESWVKSDGAALYYNDERSEEGKAKRIEALEAGITVITEPATLLAFIRSQGAGGTPIRLTEYKIKQGVNGV